MYETNKIRNIGSFRLLIMINIESDTKIKGMNNRMTYRRHSSYDWQEVKESVLSSQLAGCSHLS